jgi:hypothetical protein
MIIASINIRGLGGGGETQILEGVGVEGKT